MTRQEQKAAAFRTLHAGEPFVMPNPWDPGSARMLEALGFEALATTSSSFAFTLGRRDGQATLDEVVEHTAALDRTTVLPLSVDLENGYGATTREVAQAVTRVAVDAAHALPYPFLLTARAENHIRGNPDLDDTIARLQAYEEAGADVLYASGLKTVDEIRTVCGAVSRPVNVLAARSVSETARRRRRAADQRRRRAHLGRGSGSGNGVGGDRHSRPRRLLAARRRPPARRMAGT
jgi:2-methylisocitrate lyase-like PEP mutase family enzyme